MSVLSYGGPAGAKQTRDLYPEVVQVEDVQNPPVVRVKMGKLNGTYGIEVYTADGVLAFSSANNVFKIHATGIAAVSIPSRGGPGVGNASYAIYTHGLGYVPMVQGMLLDAGLGAGRARVLSGDAVMQIATFQTTALMQANAGCTFWNNCYNTPFWTDDIRTLFLSVDSTTLYLTEYFALGGGTSIGGFTANVRYYVLVETGAPT